MKTFLALASIPVTIFVITVALRWVLFFAEDNRDEWWSWPFYMSAGMTIAIVGLVAIFAGLVVAVVVNTNPVPPLS